MLYVLYCTNIGTGGSTASPYAILVWKKPQGDVVGPVAPKGTTLNYPVPILVPGIEHITYVTYSFYIKIQECLFLYKMSFFI